MNVADYMAIWRSVDLTERSGAQQHFLGLCELLGHPKPVEMDPTGESFTFERGAWKNAGGEGFADVWKRGFFGWEYKGKHRDLDRAYHQLLQYREALENPPLLVVCDMEQIVIRTNFTATPTQRYEVRLAEMDRPEKLALLRRVFFEPERLKPGTTTSAITTAAARRLGEIARTLHARGLPALDVAHFLDRIIFCLFAGDTGLLPKGLIGRVLRSSQGDPHRFRKLLIQLFEAMAHGGDFGAEKILHFNGNLFTDTRVLDLEPGEIERIAEISSLDWSAVDPSIFGTLFERSLDPAQRSKLGAHYTSRADIEILVEPVVMQPLRREWADIRLTCDNLLSAGKKRPASGDSRRRLSPAQRGKAAKQAKALIGRFLHQRLPSIRVLDPACGSGNFLYVSLQKLKDLEKEVILYAAKNGMGGFLPMVGPWQLYGIEVNPYAYELAQMTVWIGYLQWVRDNGLGAVSEPILRKLDNFKCMDALIDLSDPAHPREPEWPKADFIVGNPPFLGDKLMRSQLGGEYVERLRRFYEGRVPGGADLCCYWFERARAQISAGRCQRAGLLATQGIRGGANRRVLDRIKATGDIFFAESDRPWVLDGAQVHVSMLGFDARQETARTLDGRPAPVIHSNLTSTANVAQAVPRAENASVAFLGSCKGGRFDLAEEEALRLLRDMGNPNGRPNSDVVRPVFNSEALVKRSTRRWIIDNADRTLEAACLYEAPHRLVVERVKPFRAANRDPWLRENWWRPQRMRPEMRVKVAPLERFLVTTTTSKHRLFAWLAPPALPDHQLVVFARADDYFFGILHSRIHEVWALKLGTRLETRPRYTPTSCFETFPLPRPTSGQEEAIAAAAQELDARRSHWLRPPEWTKEEALEFPGSADGPWARHVVNPDGNGIGTVRYRRLAPKDDACATLLARRTLTNLYNARPDWLRLAHDKLDAAVCAAYGWDAAIAEEEIIERLLELNRQEVGREGTS